METSETGTLLKAGLRPPWMLAPFDCDIQSGGSNHFKVESMRDFSVLCVCVCVCVCVPRRVGSSTVPSPSSLSC